MSGSKGLSPTYEQAPAGLGLLILTLFYITIALFCILYNILTGIIKKGL